MRSLILIALGAVAFAGCGGDDGGGDPEPPRAVGPPECLEQAGLKDVKQRDVDLWRAFDSVDGTILLVEIADSPAEAQRLEREAANVWTQVVGRNFISGPTKPPFGTSTRGEGNVEAVAKCLRADDSSTRQDTVAAPKTATDELSREEDAEYFESNVKYELIETLSNRGSAAPVVLNFKCNWSSATEANCSGVAYDHAEDLGSCGYPLLPCGRFQASVHAVCTDSRALYCEYPEGIEIKGGEIRR